MGAKPPKPPKPPKLAPEEEGRLSIRMDRANVRAIHIAALQSGVTVRDFVLVACTKAGAVIKDEQREK
jgi:uncharacterized protein (DUF1778 family)